MRQSVYLGKGHLRGRKMNGRKNVAVGKKCAEVFSRVRKVLDALDRQMFGRHSGGLAYCPPKSAHACIRSYSSRQAPLRAKEQSQSHRLSRGQSPTFKGQGGSLCEREGEEISW